MLVLHLLIDCCDAMGANLINTMAEGIAPMVEELTGGRVFLRILSNLADRRLVRASCRIPFEHLAWKGYSGREVAEGIARASEFAEADPYRAATHNKGVMNGISAVCIATGNDWRAVEAGAHAYCCREGRYGPMATWHIEGEELVGRLEVPMQVGTVGGPIRLHPTVQLVHEILDVSGADELAEVIGAVGLAQNMAAIKALATEGIQRGHMSLHARSVAATAGARESEVPAVVEALVEGGEIKVSVAREILAQLRADDQS
jgi:hydroxymethylglutaryl-CoA reductase